MLLMEHLYRKYAFLVAFPRETKVVMDGIEGIAGGMLDAELAVGFRRTVWQMEREDFVGVCAYCVSAILHHETLLKGHQALFLALYPDESAYDRVHVFWRTYFECVEASSFSPSGYGAW